MEKVMRGIFITLSARYGKVFLHVFTAGIIILLCTAKALPADDLQRAEYLFDEGTSLYNKSDFRGVAEKWEKALATFKKV